MELNEAKQLINCKGERVILVENGIPTIVLLSFEEYKKLSGSAENGRQRGLFNNALQGGVISKPQEPQNELTLEDLPF